MFRRIALLCALVLGMGMSSVCQAGLHDHPTVAVMPFKNKAPDVYWESFGDYSGQATESLISKLSARYDVFNLVDREYLQDLIEEQSLGMTGLSVDGPEVGRLLGVEYKIYGSVTGLTTKENHVSFGTYEGDLNFDNTQHRVFAHVTLRLIELSTGRIMLVAQGDGASTSTNTAVGTLISLGTKFVSPEQAYNAIDKAIEDAVYGKQGLLTQLGYGNNDKGGKK
ncbi:CsgG/HfaB family protein [uncultured Selenomonas sp.]|uniref:CsgG/HfaB family protein n=1 Tax=uncultured Selenomonas sp. TaxID=159275 RepID=UPI0028E4DE7F|nr:CsgG/HfaB family protein [uncultured Selenomonas sp.]